MSGWKITWRGSEWSDEDITAQDLCTVQMLLGGGWESCDPTAGPLQLSAMIAALALREKGDVDQVDAVDVLVDVRSCPATELMGALSVSRPSSEG